MFGPNCRRCPLSLNLTSFVLNVSKFCTLCPLALTQLGFLVAFLSFHLLRAYFVKNSNSGTIYRKLKKTIIISLSSLSPSRLKQNCIQSFSIIIILLNFQKTPSIHYKDQNITPSLCYRAQKNYPSL
ncbi:hypothetical protein Hanom_Chr09g00766421 [Helianthus anomalus]